MRLKRFCPSFKISKFNIILICSQTYKLNLIPIKEVKYSNIGTPGKNEFKLY